MISLPGWAARPVFDWHRFLPIAILGLSFALYFSVFGYRAFQPRVLGLDFVAFYCAGEVANDGRDPYLVDPLRSCEHRVGRSFRPGSVLVLPAPLPAYDIAFFRVIARAPFPVALGIWTFGLFVSMVWCVALLRGATGLGGSVVWAVLGLSLGYVSLSLGQVAPVSILGLLLLARAVAVDSPYYATLGFCLASAEPHLALPGILACSFVGRRSTRLGLALGCVIALVLSFVAMPFGEIVEYFTAVLPAHALSEISNREQFSLSYYLHLVGLSEAISVKISELAYAGMVLLGVLLSRRFVRMYGPEMAVLGATTFGLAFGPFLHVTQVAAAVPAALVGFSRSGRRSFGWAAWFSAVPWISFAPLIVVAPFVVVVTGYVGSRLCGLRSSIGVALGCLGLVGCLFAADALGSDPARRLPNFSTRPSDLSEVVWRRAVDFSDVGRDFMFGVAKLPSHLGVAFVIFSLLRRRVSGVQ